MKNLCFLIISPSVSRRYQIHSSSVHSALFIIHDLRDPIVSGIYKNFIFSLSMFYVLCIFMNVVFQNIFSNLIMNISCACVLSANSHTGCRGNFRAIYSIYIFDLSQRTIMVSRSLVGTLHMRLWDASKAQISWINPRFGILTLRDL